MKIINSKLLPADEIMLKDAELLQNLSTTSECLLHLYEWAQPCLTYGCFTKPEEHLCLDTLTTYGWQMARRPTGGGIIFHLTDLAFSFLIPASHPAFSLKTLDNYAFVNQIVAKAIANFHSGLTPDLYQQGCCQRSSFCMSHPTIYDLVLAGKKVGGAAQRRTKNGLLHQGSISVSRPPLDQIESTLKQGKQLTESMQTHSYYLIDAEISAEQLTRTRKELKQMLISAFDESSHQL